MAKQNIVAVIFNKVCEKYPDIASTRTATSNQLKSVCSYIHQSMNQYKVSRGVYRFPEDLIYTPSVEHNDSIEQDTTHSQCSTMEMHNALSSVTSISSMKTFDESAMLIPKIDPNYVAFGNHTMVEKIIKSNIFYPVYITGPTGNGKSTMVEQVCAKLKRPLIRINLNAMTDEDQLIGTKTLVDGNIQVVEGPILKAMKNGYILLLDEIDVSNSNTILCIQNIMEGKPYYFKLNNTIIHPAKGFNVFATANTKGKGSDDGRYIGTNILNEAFLERFGIVIEQDYPSAAIETQIIRKAMVLHDCYDDNEQLLALLIKWVSAIRKTYNNGGIEETITTRRLLHIVKAYSIFKNIKKSIELCCNRFDATTKAGFIELFNNLSPEDNEDTNQNSESDTSEVKTNLDNNV
jgi:hypothetical protein